MLRLLILTLAFASAQSHAQQRDPNSSAWFSVDYTYTDFTYKESAMSEKGRLAGVRGELGVSLMGGLALAFGGEYQDGNLYYDGATFSGTPVKQVTKDYMRDLRVGLQWMMAPVIVSVGAAQREWYDDLVVSYRRRTSYSYYPVALTLYRESIYIKVENDIWGKGKNKSYMSDVNPAEKDVEFTQKSGSGYGVEIGYMVPTTDRFFSRAFIGYHRWDVGDSDIQNDGVYNLQEPKNNTVTVQAGLGFVF